MAIIDPDVLDPYATYDNILTEWNEFGSIACQKISKKNTFGNPPRNPVVFMSLLPLKQKVLPITLPAGLHYYRMPPGSYVQVPGDCDDTGIFSRAFVCKTYKVDGYDDVDTLLGRPGIHYLLYMEDVSAHLGGRTCHVRIGHVKDKESIERTLFQPMTVADILAGGLSRPAKQDTSAFPHKCPRCQGPAYIGLNSIECMRRCV